MYCQKNRSSSSSLKTHWGFLLGRQRGEEVPGGRCHPVRGGAVSKNCNREDKQDCGERGGKSHRGIVPRHRQSRHQAGDPGSASLEWTIPLMRVSRLVVRRG